jgi:hypothetical protein
MRQLECSIRRSELPSPVKSIVIECIEMTTGEVFVILQVAVMVRL